MDEELTELKEEKLRLEIRSLRFERVRMGVAVVGAATLVIGVFAQG